MYEKGLSWTERVVKRQGGLPLSGPMQQHHFRAWSSETKMPQICELSRKAYGWTKVDCLAINRSQGSRLNARRILFAILTVAFSACGLKTGVKSPATSAPLWYILNMTQSESDPRPKVFIAGRGYPSDRLCERALSKYMRPENSYAQCVRTTPENALKYAQEP